jgi:hypothetical protein
LNISSDKRSVMDNLSVQTGIEYWIIPELAVRVGLSPVKFNPIGLNDSNKLLQSLGLGLKLNSLRFDFSWTNQPANLDIIQIEDVYRFSIGYVFEDDQVRVAEIETPVAQEVNRVATAPVVQRIIPEQTVTKNVVTEDVVATVNENLLEVSLKGPKLLTGEEGTYTYEIKGGSGKEYDVDLHIKDSYGTTVRNLVVERKYDSGKYRVVWGGQDNHLQVLENGEYYLRLFVTCNGKEVATSFMKVVLDK